MSSLDHDKAGRPDQDQTPPRGCQRQDTTDTESSGEPSEGSTSFYYVIDEGGPIQRSKPDGMNLGGFKNGTLQKNQDVCWAILFYVHLLSTIAALCYNVFRNENTINLADANYGAIILMVVLTSGVAALQSALTLRLMTTNAAFVVRLSLVFSVFSSLAISIFGGVIESPLVWFLGAIAFVISLCYTLTGKFVSLKSRASSLVGLLTKRLMSRLR
jgi:hypothetical protein